MSLEIRKKGTKNFFHYWDSFTYSASDLTIITSGSTVFLRAEDGRVVGERDGWNITDISIYDDTDAGTQETFVSVIAFTNRLIVLGYPAYYDEDEILWGNISGDINNQTDLITLINTINGSQPVENEYANVAAMLADQGNQTTTFFQYVIDTEEYYEKLSTSNASIDDYRLLSDTETITITDSNGYRVFRIQYIQDDSSPNDTATGGRIGFNYDTGTDKVTSVVFNNIYSNALDIFYSLRASYDYYLKIYNRNTGVYSFAYITSWTVNGNYYIVNVDNTMDISEISVNNRVEVYFLLDQNTGGGGGSGTVTSVAVSGSDGIEVDSGSPITSSGTIALGLNKTSTLTFLNVEDGADATDAVNVGSSMNGASAKTTPVDADTMPLNDSADSNLLKKVTWANIKATLKTYFDTLYTSLAGSKVDRLEEDATVTGTKNIDWGSYETFYYTMTGACTFSDTNLPSSGSKTITIHMTGDFAPTYPSGWDTYISGTYDGTVLNTIVVEYVKAGTPFYKVQISQPD